MANIFQDPTKTLPMKTDDQIVRVNMEELEIGGRKSHLPGQMKSDKMTVQHVPNAGSSK
jgi:hypothetical protein